MADFVASVLTSQAMLKGASGAGWRQGQESIVLRNAASGVVVVVVVGGPICWNGGGL